MTTENTSLQLVSSNNELSSLKSYCTKEFNFSWEKDSIPHPARYGLFLTQNSMQVAFTCPKNAWTERCDASGSYIEGLWQYDVGEFFISNNTNNEYLEFNLSPSGAWWCCYFNSYRERSQKNNPIQGVKTFAQPLTPTGWFAAIEIPINSLKIEFQSLNDLCANVCMIEGKEQKHYLSAAVIKTKEPDFHQADSFLPLSL
jgi:hypothetical protein